LKKPVTIEVEGRSLIEGIPKAISVDDSEIREALNECLAAVVSAISAALERPPPELSALRSSVRGSDAVFRYRGDEFLIILADTSRTGTAKVIERIRAYLLDWNRAATLEGFEPNLSISVSEWSDGVTLDQLLDEADREMYAAKANHTLSKHRPSSSQSCGSEDRALKGARILRRVVNFLQ
jgi:Diguanylate cyclase, GGDEF domain/MreB/Mbl protein